MIGWQPSILDNRCRLPRCGLPASIEVSGFDSLLGLAPGGGCLAGSVASAAGRLLPCHFTLTSGEPEAYCFCGPIRRIAPPGRYPAPCSMEFGLSSDGSKPSAAARPPWASVSYHACWSASRIHADGVHAKLVSGLAIRLRSKTCPHAASGDAGSSLDSLCAHTADGVLRTGERQFRVARHSQAPAQTGQPAISA